MWTYKSKTGEFLYSSGASLGFGFAGQALGLNDPLYQHRKNTGPPPAGKYKLTKWIEKHPTLGRCVIVMEPFPDNEMYGRAEFRIHGATSLLAYGLHRYLHSSEGCICIGDCVTRKLIWASPDHELFVDPS